MSEKLYLKRPGKKALKLSFTADDIPLLKKWYEDGNKRDGLTNAPDFKDLPITTKNNMAKTLSYAQYRLNYRWKELKTAIKNFFLCTHKRV